MSLSLPFVAIISTKIFGSHLLVKNSLHIEHCQFDKLAIKVLNGEQTVGHLPREYSRIAWYFLARGGSITLEVTGRRRHCKQLCGGMEILCCVRFSCSRKATINRLNNFKYYRVHDARHQPNDCYHHSINPFLDETMLKGRIVACTCSK